MTITKTTIRDEIKKIEEKIDGLKAKIAIEQEVLSRFRALENPNNAPRQRKRRGNSLGNRIVGVLKESGEPMHVQDITEKLKEVGVSTNSEHGLGAMVSSALRKDKRIFTRIDRGIYGLKERSAENKTIIAYGPD